jgi:YidC/Oxa1 family membrane protein insertase
MWNIFSTIIYEPLYNALVFLISIMPGGNVGLAIIVLTLLVKILLFPLAKRATQTQITTY